MLPGVMLHAGRKAGSSFSGTDRFIKGMLGAASVSLAGDPVNLGAPSRLLLHGQNAHR